jgi:hypothetical protein|nr:MAG TPA: hypothetical protein [Caudoviricetes sp.]
MIQLLKMGNLKVVKTYNDLNTAKLDIVNKNAEKYLIKYKNNLYTINRFLEMKEVNVK